MTDRMGIKLDPKLHKTLKMLSVEKEISLNDLVVKVLEEFVMKEGKKKQ